MSFKDCPQRVLFATSGIGESAANERRSRSKSGNTAAFLIAITLMIDFAAITATDSLDQAFANRNSFFLTTRFSTPIWSSS